MKKPLILVTNDDGITAPGLRTLIHVMNKIGEVVVVAPDSPQSGMGHAITISDTLYSKKEKMNMQFNSKLVDFEVTLIRAPKIIEIGDETQVLLDIDDSPIAIYNGMHMGLSFHPELNGVTLFHDSLFRGSVNSNFQAPGNINAA